MDEKITVVLADIDPRHCGELCAILNDAGCFEIVGVATDGPQTRELVMQRHPRLVVADLWLPRLDGLSLLRCFREMEGGPEIILMSAFCTDRVIAEAARRGAFYCMAKPVDAVSLVEQMCLAADMPLITPDTVLRELLLLPHSMKFKYLSRALALVLQDEDILNAMTKELYPAVAKEFRTTDDGVEVTIRRAIATVWKTAPRNILRKYFPTCCDGPRPNNSVFIAQLADYLRRYGD